MPTVKVNDINMYYEVHGEGEPLVMIQGLGTDIEVAGPLIAKFAKNCRVVAFDNRGAGRSDRPDAHYTVETMAEDTVGLMDALGMEKAHILGISLGSRVAQAIAAKYPDRVKGLVLNVSAAHVPHKEDLKVTLVMWMMHFMIATGQLHKKIPGKYPPDQKSLLRQQAANLEFNGRGLLGKIKAPTLIVNGSKDVSNPVKCADELARGIRSSKLVLVEEDHFFAGTKPELLVRPALAFMAEVDAQTAVSVVKSAPDGGLS